MRRHSEECNICGETLLVECDVSGDDDSPIPGKQIATYFSCCPNKCNVCGEHFNEEGKCEDCDKGGIQCVDQQVLS
jgi:hypothetical protein